MKVETYEKDYIMAKKKESYEYLEKKHTEFARKYNNEDGTFNSGALNIPSYFLRESSKYTVETLEKLEVLSNVKKERYKRTKRLIWRKIDL